MPDNRANLMRLTITLERRGGGEGWVAFVDDGTDKDGVLYGPHVDAPAVLHEIGAAIDWAEFEEFIASMERGDA